MKVVLFCGGQGMRLRDFSEHVPKPMVPLGDRPILWHLMKYYAHYGHKEFILCLGYKGDMIKRYFLNYDEWLTNDFVMEGNQPAPKMLNTDIHDWKITFVDTGQHANIGQRLKAVEKFIGKDEMFLANYADGLSDLPLPKMQKFFEKRDKIGSFVCVSPVQTFHAVTIDKKGNVKGIRDLTRSGITINGGFFIFKRELFKYILPGEDLIHHPFRRLIDRKELVAYEYDGFWACMDTYKEKQRLDDVVARGQAPWQVWRPRTRSGSRS